MAWLHLDEIISSSTQVARVIGTQSEYCFNSNDMIHELPHITNIKTKLYRRPSRFHSIQNGMISRATISQDPFNILLMKIFPLSDPAFKPYKG